MLTLLITLLTVILVLVCILIGGLVLMQLPKKDSGAGLAFGGGAAEALFGAGAGTPLAQITKYCAGIFLLLSLTLSALNHVRNQQSESLLEAEAARQEAAEPGVPESEGAETLPPPSETDETPGLGDSGEPAETPEVMESESEDAESEGASETETETEGDDGEDTAETETQSP